METFLLLLILFFIVIPLAKAFWAVFRQVRQVRNFMKDPADYFNRAAGQQQKNSTYTTPKRKKKKIGKDVGEYIDYEDITVSSSGSGTQKDINYKTEEQVTDIKWKDL